MESAEGGVECCTRTIGERLELLTQVQYKISMSSLHDSVFRVIGPYSYRI